MRVSVVIATYGDSAWRDLAYDRAKPSAVAQRSEVTDIIVRHGTSLAGTRNLAAQQGMGDWLLFLDADDELAPGYVEAMAAAAEEMGVGTRSRLALDPLLLVPAVEYVCGQCLGTGQRSTALTANGHDLERHERAGTVCDQCHGVTAPPAIPDWGRNLLDLNCGVIGTLIPHDLWRRVGGFRELPSLEDWDLWLRAVKAGARMVPVPEAVYRVFTGAATRNADQSPYQRLRAEHRPGFDWANVGAYKVAR